MFKNDQESHAHSLKTLNLLYEYDDFMSSIGTMVDLGCGSGLDLEWWATRTTRDENPEPLNIRCTGVDVFETLPVAHRYKNIVYQQTDFETSVRNKKDTRYDVLWCHNSFQYAINPFETLRHWWNIANDSAMLAIIVPQTTNYSRTGLTIKQDSGCYYHYTLINLIHMLAMSGWDCASGFFYKDPQDTWLHAIVYKNPLGPLDPKTHTWYSLAEKKLIPESVAMSVEKRGYVNYQDLVLPWVDHSLTWYGKQ